MTNFAAIKHMLEKVAEALGPELCEEVTFVGGCATSLLLTDELTKEEVRATDDVDLVVNTIGTIGFHKLQKTLRNKGFKDPGITGDDPPPICAMLLGGLQVDFMPDDENVLGFGNRWYKSAMETSTYHDLTPEIRIKLVTPVFFVATKLEAFNGRGNGDALSSRDIEDIVNLVDGRAELVDEIIAAEKDVKEYIASEIIKLLSNPDFESAVSSQAKGDHDRQNILFERLEIISEQIQ